MKKVHRSAVITLALLASLLCPAGAGATEGYFLGGYGVTQGAFSGAGVAYPTDAMCRPTSTGPAGFDVSERRLIATYPAFKEISVVASWAGMIDVTPDALPVISAIDTVPGLFVATGVSGHGFGIGPGAGNLAAELIAGDQPSVDPHPFRFSRFSTN